MTFHVFNIFLFMAYMFDKPMYDSMIAAGAVMYTDVYIP